MPEASDPIFAVPTNIITGFLGAGKTTFILELLKNKPLNERWAVLVNEFGEVGIDGTMLAGNISTDVVVREVPGGCFCCTNGLPVQVALNKLLATAKPSRLLIEPTGLGHPQEILALLRSAQYQTVLDVRATFTLVDARKLQEERYLNNSTFQQQLKVADVLIASKADLYRDDDVTRLLDYAHIHLHAPKILLTNKGKTLLPSEFASLDVIPFSDDLSSSTTLLSKITPTPEAILPAKAFSRLDITPVAVDAWTLLQAPSMSTAESLSTHSTPIPTVDFSWPTRLPDCGYLHKQHNADGYFSSGWLFSSRWTFQYDALFALLMGTQEDRLKGVFITDKGVFAFNKSGDILSELEMDDALDSRIEIIHHDKIPMDAWQADLLSATIQ